MPDDDPRAHYVVRADDLPPTSVECKCGERFTSGDVLAAVKAHMDERNPSDA